MAFSIFHWIIVLLIIGLPVLAIVAAIRIFRNRKS